MIRINPITPQQFSELFTGFQEEDDSARPASIILRKGESSMGTVNVVTGVIHGDSDKVLYYGRSEEWLKTALRAIRSNNPCERFELVYE